MPDMAMGVGSNPAFVLGREGRAGRRSCPAGENCGRPTPRWGLIRSSADAALFCGRLTSSNSPGPAAASAASAPKSKIGRAFASSHRGVGRPQSLPQGRNVVRRGPPGPSTNAGFRPHAHRHVRHPQAGAEALHLHQPRQTGPVQRQVEGRAFPAAPCGNVVTTALLPASITGIASASRVTVP